MEKANKSIELASVLDSAYAERLFCALLERRGSSVTLDASKVSRLGAQCAQILVAAAQTWSADGCALQWRAPSEPLVEGLLKLGIAPSILGMTEVTHV